MYKYLVTVLVVGFLVSGCDSFLRETPKSFVTPQEFYKDESQATTAVYGVYDSYAGVAEWPMLQIGDVASDVTNGRTGDANVIFESHEWSPTLGQLESLWENSYTLINRANAIIERVPEADIDDSVTDRIVSEARFLRAAAYFNLVRVYGGVPLVVEETRSLSNLEVPRASENEVYDQIINDLQAAESSLPLNAAEGRATQGAAKGMLAKVHLTHESFEQARDKAQEVMNMEKYGLWENYREAFLQANEGGKEDIFSVQHATDIGEGGGHRNVTFPPELGPWFCCGPMVQHWAPTEKLINSYDMEDTRKQVNAAGSILIEEEDTTVTFATPAHLKTADGFVSRQNDSDAGNNFHIIRYADVVLTFAEAENEINGPTPAAREAINKIIRRAHGVDLNESSAYDVDASIGQEAFRDVVLEERFKEFPEEGHRWFDLKRTGRLVEVLGIPEHRSLFPIPLRDLQVNSMLEQNPGY